MADGILLPALQSAPSRFVPAREVSGRLYLRKVACSLRRDLDKADELAHWGRSDILDSHVWRGGGRRKAVEVSRKIWRGVPYQKSVVEKVYFEDAQGTGLAVPPKGYG